MRKPGGGLADLVDAETFDGTIALCEVVGTEPTLNLAVIKLALYPNAEPPVLAPVTIADPEAIRVGHWAIAVGDPLGPQRVFAAGLISARPERDCYQAELAATFLEASLQVHPEAYGGPLVDLQGQVMGIDRSASGPASRRGRERPRVCPADEHRHRDLRIAQGRSQLRVALAGRFGPADLPSIESA